MDEELQVTVDRNDLVMRIELANAISLFDDARQNIQLLILHYGKELTREETVLFSVVYKTLIDKFRKEYNTYVGLQRKIPRTQYLKQRIIRDNIHRARYEMVTICVEVIEHNNKFASKNFSPNVLESFKDMIDHGILETENIKRKIYFMKLRADYYRYWSNVASENQVSGLRGRAEDCYQMALDLADKELKKFHPIRLGLMFNMSKHYYAVPRERIKAFQIAMQAVTDGKEHHVDDDPEVRKVVDLLQDKLNTWMACLGVAEVHELEMLEGARKWHGKGAAIPSIHLRRYLSGEPTRTLEDLMPENRKYFSIQQPLIKYSDLDEMYISDYGPVSDPLILFEPIFKLTFAPPTIAPDTPESTAAKSQSTETESIITTHVPIAASTRLATTESLPVAVIQNSNSIELLGNEHPFTSPEESQNERQHASHEKQASREGYGEREPLGDPFEGIFQLILGPSSTSSSSSTTSSQSLDEDDEGGNDNPEQRINRPSTFQTSAPLDVPRMSQCRLTPTTMHPVGGLIERLRSSESITLSRRESQIRHKREAIERESEVRHSHEGDDLLPELLLGNVTINEELQIPSSVMAVVTTPSSTYILQPPLTSELSSHFETQITSEPHNAEKLQPPTDHPIRCDQSADLQQQFATSTKQPDIRYQQQPDISKTESAKSSKANEQPVFSEPSSSSSPPRVIFTPLGPKIVGNFSPSSLEGIVAAASPSSFMKEKSKAAKIGTGRSSRRRGTRQRPIRSRFLRSPPPPKREQEPPCLPMPHRQSQGQALESRWRKWAQRKLLRRSFSAPQEGAIWPVSSLIREPPYFIYKVLRRASATGVEPFGRRFLSAHSSAEDLYDEATEKAFPDPWAPRGTRTMLNTFFPITQPQPIEKPRVPWIRHH